MEWLGAERAARWPLHLVTCQPADRLHSQLDPAPATRANKVAGREAVLLHPDDAAERGIAQGDVCLLYTSRAWWPARVDALKTLLKDMDQ